jgi:hypothetical protein
MGIWPADSDGTDVNSVDVCKGVDIVSIASMHATCCLNGGTRRRRWLAETILATLIYIIFLVLPKTHQVFECLATVRML